MTRLLSRVFNVFNCQLSNDDGINNYLRESCRRAEWPAVNSTSDRVPTWFLLSFLPVAVVNWTWWNVGPLKNKTKSTRHATTRFFLAPRTLKVYQTVVIYTHKSQRNSQRGSNEVSRNQNILRQHRTGPPSETDWMVTNVGHEAFLCDASPLPLGGGLDSDGRTEFGNEARHMRQDVVVLLLPSEVASRWKKGKTSVVVTPNWQRCVSYAIFFSLKITFEECWS